MADDALTDEIAGLDTFLPAREAPPASPLRPRLAPPPPSRRGVDRAVRRQDGDRAGRGVWHYDPSEAPTDRMRRL